MTDVNRESIVLPSLTIGFGMTVSMWLGGYLVRMPSIMLPSAFLLFYFVFCLLVGGWIAGRYTLSAMKNAAGAGIVSAVLNLLVLGSLLSGGQPGRMVPTALLWLPGSILFSVILAAIGAWIGKQMAVAVEKEINWPSYFAFVAMGATFLLLVAGGLVTSNQAGLAVVDWPNSFGYSMFLFPLSRMTGGIYYEHTHRLMGSLVGLTTIVLAVILQWREKCPWLKMLGWFAVVLVIAQGIMGGLRVTGTFTMSQNVEDVAPNIILAVVHGVTGQVFFCLVTSLAIFSSTLWKRTEPQAAAHAPLDRTFSTILVAVLLVQLSLGALLRHLESMMLLHISVAVIVLSLVVLCGIRAWGLNAERPVIYRLGLWLVAVVSLQFTLGFFALMATMTTKESGTPTTYDVLLTTSHQAVGAILFASAVALMFWTYHLLKPLP